MDYQQLAADYGTGCFFFLNSRLIKNIRSLQSAFAYPGLSTIIAYSVKANYWDGVIETVKNQELCFDCASSMELDLLLKRGVSPSKIWVNTPFLDKDLLEKCFSNRITIHVESMEQLQQLLKMDTWNREKTPIGIRFNHSHSGERSRFGFNPDAETVNAIRMVLNDAPQLLLTTLHCHYSGWQRSVASFKKSAESLFQLYEQYFRDSTVEALNIGGGIYGPMDSALRNQFNDVPTDWNEYAHSINDMKKKLAHYGVGLVLEPGMALVADTFVYLAEVLSIKAIQDVNYALINSSINFLKPTRHNKQLSFNVFTCNNAGSIKKHELVGITCMENDVLGNYEGKLQIGDLVCFENIGAYTLSCVPNFIFSSPRVITI